MMSRETLPPLHGIQVVDFTRVLSGPYATMVLADLGADVIKIEEVEHGDETRSWGPPYVGEQSTYFMSVNRGKRSVKLDLKSEDGIRQAQRLIANADIVTENFRPGVMKRLGLDYETVRTSNPSLIYASISGYGQDSTESHKPGYDPIIQARSGLMSITGPQDGGPARVGVAISDISASMWLLVGVLSALNARHERGHGEHIDIALYDSQVSWLINVAGAWFATGQESQRYGTGHPSIVPSGTFQASDGQLMLAVGNERMWSRFASVLDRPEFTSDDRFTTNSGRVTHRVEFESKLNSILSEKTTDEWLALLDRAHIPSSRVNSIEDTLTDPLVHERKMILTMKHNSVGEVRAVNTPIKFAHSRLNDPLPPPIHGEHTHQVLENERENQDLR